MSHIFAEFSECMKNGKEADSDETQDLVKALQNHINEKFYLCTNENSAILGQMYVADERFKNNIDKNGEGTAEFVSEAIKTFCER